MILRHNTLGLISGEQPVNIMITYDTTAPYEVVFLFREAEVSWTFARDLLLEVTQNNKAGEGDVLLTSDRVTIVMVLRNGVEEQAQVWLSHNDITGFVNRIYEHTPAGDETIAGFDQELAKWIAAA